MASLKDIKRQIGAVGQTAKLTKAMNMVAAAKLRITQGRTQSFRDYAMAHEMLVREIGKRAIGNEHPLLKSNPEIKRVEILAFASDRGLCGGFNTNLINFLDKKVRLFKDEGLEPSLFLVGRKLKDYYSRRAVDISHAMIGIMNSFDYLLAQEIADLLIKDFLERKYREVWLLTTRFQGMGSQAPVWMQFLPLVHGDHESKSNLETPESDKSEGHDFLVEPDAQTLYGRLIPRSLTIMIYQSMLESVTSENAARMQAMDNASQNCEEITTELTSVYNKVRQASVTNELLDIVNGSEALTAG